MSFPSRSQLDEYVASVETYITSTIHSARPDIQGLSDAVNDVWAALSRFVPPELQPLPHLPGLCTFEVPPPPPLPPPATFLHGDGWIEWAKENKLLAGAGVVTIGVGLGYGASAYARKRRAMRRHCASAAGKSIGSDPNARKFVVSESFNLVIVSFSPP